MSNLRFYKTDKVFTEVIYMGGKVWVDNEGACTFCKWDKKDHYQNRCYHYSDESEDYFYNDRFYKPQIIARTPDVKLEGVPVVKVEDKSPLSLLMEYTTLSKDSLLGTNPEHLFNTNQVIDFMKRYATQSKGTYTEEQLMKAYLDGIKYGYDDARLNYPSPKEYLQSIQPEIVVDTIAHPDSSTMSGHFEPITFLKNGETYFKLK